MSIICSQTSFIQPFVQQTQPKKKDVLTDSVVTITQGIAHLVHCRKMELQSQRDLNPAAQSHLKFEYMWGNFDQLMQMLPPSDIVDLNFSFLKLIYEKLQQNGTAGRIGRP